MIIGLKRGVVELTDHDPEWEIIAADTIKKLWVIFGASAKDIQHVGSTSIKNIKAKPVIDIVVSVLDFDDVLVLSPMLEEQGFICVGWEENGKIHPMYQCGEFVSGEKLPRVLTHFIHIVIADSQQWYDYINHRDYMNTCSAAAHKYEELKLRLAEENSDNYNNYFLGKQDYIKETVSIARIWNDFGRRFTKIETVTKGWSEDKKYCVAMSGGEKYLLRITPIERYEPRKALFDMLGQVSALGIPMCVPVESGTCADGVYSLQSWINGEDLETVLPVMTDTEKYVIGLKSGEILKKIHSIPAPEAQEEWEPRFNRKTDYKIQKYHECGLRFEGDGHILEYLEQNRFLLKDRPQCFQHGDYHAGNMMLENRELVIIDFDRYDFGDPWEEFNRIVWSAAASPHFATGQLRGYFGGEPPLEFFKLLAFYIASNTLSSVYWAVPFGQSEINTMLKQSQDVLRWFDNMKNPVPSWYLNDFYIQYTDGIPYKLKEPFDFSFLSKYGRVFKVFDSQDSGNICFGVQSDSGKRYFIKFAGAPADEYTGTVESAVERLKAAVQPYMDLKHPSLINFIEAEDTSSGFAVVFNWVDAVCAHRMYPSDHKKFWRLELSSRLVIFEDILDFHRLAAEKGYTAVDFYDGSIMWDYKNERTVICDIDFYTKGRAYGNKALWGHMARTASPEERTDGVLIDEISNVYNMGAIAFVLLADGGRSPEEWRLNEDLYKVALKAVSEKRSERQQSIKEFIAEWKKSK